MTKDHRRVDAHMAQEILLDDPAFLGEIVERVVQQLLEAEMTEHIGAAPYERSVTCTGHRNGYKPRTLMTRVGTLNLLVPQDREGTFSTRLFSRYQRNEKALVVALMEMCTSRESQPGRSRRSLKSCAAPPSQRASSLLWPAPSTQS
jgi:putative transposase